MRRATMLSLIVAGAVAVLAIPGAAFAGGGCHGGATQQDVRDEDEATVRMIDACFQATLTTVDPGTPVTFVNDDIGLVHNLGGNGWGHFDDMVEGDTFRATFDTPGIYPFACNYHPGMSGAIVVGDATGAGNGEDVTVVPFEPVVGTAKVLPTAEAGGSAPLALVGIGILGALLGGGIAAAALRTKRSKAIA